MMPTDLACSCSSYLSPKLLGIALPISAFVFLLLPIKFVCAQSTAPSDHSVLDRSLGADKLGSAEAAWCSALKRVAALATTRERFSSIAGKPREGNFLDTSLQLPGWNQCSLYGPRTYTCDSQHVETAERAEKEQAKLVREIKACLADDWAENESRSSVGYVVLHNASGPASITVSTDQIATQEYVVRLTLFLRGN
jgi:hypothetical protein